MTDIVCFLFVGPTAYCVDLPAMEGLSYRPPIRRGDIDTLIASEPPGALVIVDGTYHNYPAVAHAEIRRAMEAGWAVWGLSSMGAIRAAEMHAMGMRGFGKVFEAFHRNGDLADDEVALLHSVEQPYIPLSEPLIHIRELMAGLELQGRVTADAAASILHRLKEMWFGYRTLSRVRDLLAEHGFGAANVDIGPYRIKTVDLQRFLLEAPWREDATDVALSV